jgi:hypothetical protein
MSTIDAEDRRNVAEKGKTFPGGPNRGSYAPAIAQALKRGLGDTHRAIKTVMRWTGAGERAVKNWFAGVNGPSSQHLIALIRHSDEVLDVLLFLTGREQTIAAKKLVDARDKLAKIFALIKTLMDEKEPESTQGL